MDNNEELPKICVIMSTYNGEKYLKEQIDSILNQKDVALTLYISDDCSTDKTVEIIKEYQEKYNNIILHINEKNKNFTYNFLDSLFEFKDNEEYDYYAFSDQDDVWLDEKLITGIRKIESTGKNTLYCSNLKIVDENLIDTNKKMISQNYKVKHYDVLSKNIVTGCTIIFDKEFKNTVTEFYPNNIYLHDYWLALIANYIKNSHFICDTESLLINYRQHASNLIGSNNGYIGKFFKKKPYIKTTLNLIRAFCDLYKEFIIDEDVTIFEKLCDYKRLKNKFFLIKNVKSNFNKEFRIKILFNKY